MKCPTLFENVKKPESPYEWSREIISILLDRLLENAGFLGRAYMSFSSKYRKHISVENEITVE